VKTLLLRTSKARPFWAFKRREVWVVILLASHRFQRSGQVGMTGRKGISLRTSGRGGSEKFVFHRFCRRVKRGRKQKGRKQGRYSIWQPARVRIRKMQGGRGDSINGFGKREVESNEKTTI